MIVKLLTEHHLEFLSLKGGYRGSPESTLVKMPHCWKSHVAAQIVLHLESGTHWHLLKISATTQITIFGPWPDMRAFT